MSRRREPPLPYDRFRTGYTYRDVYHMIYGRKHKRRRGVLGYWHELKQKMYAEYLRQHNDPKNRRRTFVASKEPIPW